MRCHFCGSAAKKMTWSRVACDDCCADPDLSSDIDEEERMAQEAAEMEALDHLEDVQKGYW